MKMRVYNDNGSLYGEFHVLNCRFEGGRHIVEGKEIDKPGAIKFHKSYTKTSLLTPIKTFEPKIKKYRKVRSIIEAERV